MAKVKRKTSRAGAARRRAARAPSKVVARGARALRRIEVDLPPTLRGYAKRLHPQLTRLQRQVERAELRTRRQAARLLREASHRLGRFEAEGEKRWRKLTTRARSEALSLLRRMEKALDSAKSAPRRKARRAMLRHPAKAAAATRSAGVWAGGI